MYFQLVIGHSKHAWVVEQHEGISQKSQKTGGLVLAFVFVTGAAVITRLSHCMSFGGNVVEPCMGKKEVGGKAGVD